MDVDRGQEAREVIDRAREQEQPRLEQPVRGPVQPQRPDAGIKHDLPTRSRGGIARLDRIEITGQPAEHGDPLLWPLLWPLLRIAVISGLVRSNSSIGRSEA